MSAATESTEASNGTVVSPKKSASVKKETFQWNTPVDEFAEDVASDNETEEESEEDVYMDEDGLEVVRVKSFDLVERIKGEKFVGKYDPEEQKRLREKEIESTLNRSGKRSSKNKSNQKFPCPKCDKVWSWPWELRRHLMMHFKEKERQDATAFKCEECGKGFQWKRDLAQHKRLHTGEKLLVCSVCGKKFTTRQALLHHVVVHTGEKPFQCAQCGNRFTQPANLRTHMKKKHDGVVSKTNKCQHCQEVFPSVVAVHQHILECHQNIVAEQREMQEAERLRKQDEKRKRELKREENRKKREQRRMETQDYNDFRVRGLKEWEINYEFHIGDGIVRGVDWDRTPSNGEINCDICDRKFGWRYEIMFHNLCHMSDDYGNPKNKVCPECETVFKVPIGLKHHLLTHTGELPFLCLHCWRSFASHIDLKLHLHREHLSHLNIAAPVASATKKKPTQAEKKAAQVQAKVEHQSTAEVSYVVTDENGQHYTTGETQTIVLGADGTIMNHNNEDMIVVIQSEDFDQSQRLIVVDPSQLQHVVSGTTLTTQDGTTMILGEANDGSHSEHNELIVSDQSGSGAQVGTRYINLRFTDSSVMDDDEEGESSTILVSADHHYQTNDQDTTQYVVVTAEDSKAGIHQMRRDANVVQEMLQQDQDQGESETRTEEVDQMEEQPIDSKAGIILKYQMDQQSQ